MPILGYVDVLMRQGDELVLPHLLCHRRDKMWTNVV